MKIQSMMASERPRERIIRLGSNHLSNSELLAIVLQSGYKNESSLALASRILTLLDRGLEDLASITYEELVKVKGVGPAKACQILSAVELGRRVNIQKRQILGRVNSPQMVAAFFQKELSHRDKEQFMVVFLNTKNMISSYEIISIGSLNTSVVHPREVFNRAIKKSAAAIILVHNHPSGNPNPSREDEAITKRLVEVGQIVGIRVLDHLIVCDDTYFSFKEMDLM